MIAKTVLIAGALAIFGAAVAQEQTRKYDFSIVTADGSTHSWGSWNSNDVKNLNAGTKGDRLIFKKDGKLYVITDKQTVGRAKRALEPMVALGKQQGELGRQQGELGRKQGDLGRQQGELGRQQGQFAGGWYRDQSKDKAKAEQLQKEYAAKRRTLVEKQKALGAKQRELGNQQGELGKKQRDLGQRQHAAGQKANAEITKLIDDAISKGLTKPIS